MMVQICKDFCWTYFEYMETPQFFIDLIKEMYRIDSQKQNKKDDNNRNKSKNNT
jgi:hypothetical protein